MPSVRARRSANLSRYRMRQLSVFPAIAILLGGLLSIGGCENVEKASPRPESSRAARSFDMNVPQIMRGTVASEAVLAGYQPVVVRGYGLVVGLDGTGSRDIPPAVRAHMIAEMTRNGIGSERSGYGDLKPDTMLNSLNTAVVIVEAVIPPAAVGQRSTKDAIIRGTRFDVRVSADPRTGTESLEGGRLYTTQLRPGPLRPGGGQAAPLAQARGEIFVNPFAEPDAVERNSVTRTTGHILNGGEVLRDMPVKLRLAQPSHTRASILQNSINAKFPREPGQPEETARGESDSSIALTVPPSFRSDTQEFIRLLQHTTIRLTNPEAVAVSVRRILLNDPSLAEAASLRWQALGKRAIPVVSELYDHAEELPRMAALRAGAKLDHAIVVPHLIEMAKTGAADRRTEAIELLADMKTNPQIDVALRELLNDPDVDVRLSAYESLLTRRDPYMDRYYVGGQFILDVVESDEPLIYITQFGQPRVVIFGRDLSIDTPVFVRAWSNRFMVRDTGEDDDIEVYFRQNPDDVQSAIHRVSPELDEFIQFLGHETSVEQPEPGLGLSYGETVGALYQIWSQKYIKADFKAEQDRILAAIRRQEDVSTPTERPEFADEPEQEQGSQFINRDESDATGTLDDIAPPQLPSEERPRPEISQD